MDKHFFLIILTVCWIINCCFTVAVKQREFAGIPTPACDTLAGADSLLRSSDSVHIHATHDTAARQYTIQICTMNFSLSDSFFKGEYGVKQIRMGDLYRYIYNIYPSIEEARAALLTVRKIYPEAFIREFNNDKLGQAIDLNMNRIKQINYDER